MSTSVTSFQHAFFSFVQSRRLTAQVGALHIIPATGIFAHTMPQVIHIVAEKQSWIVLSINGNQVNVGIP